LVRGRFIYRLPSHPDAITQFGLSLYRKRQ
jgi:hypothetical protein